MAQWINAIPRVRDTRVGILAAALYAQFCKCYRPQSDFILEILHVFPQFVCHPSFVQGFESPEQQQANASNTVGAVEASKLRRFETTLTSETKKLPKIYAICKEKSVRRTKVFLRRVRIPPPPNLDLD